MNSSTGQRQQQLTTSSIVRLEVICTCFLFLLAVSSCRAVEFSFSIGGYSEVLENVGSEGYQDVVARLSPQQTVSSSEEEKTSLGVLPEGLVIRFLEARQTQDSSNGQVDVDLVEGLSGCVASDSRCALLMGNLYFQGLMPAGLLNPHDAPKNITRALGLWKYSAFQGNHEAQFKLALVFSTFYNPPSFLMDPRELASVLEAQSRARKEAAVNGEGDPQSSQDSPPDLLTTAADRFVNDLTSEFSSDFFLDTMDVLDNREYESHILKLWLTRANNQSKASCQKKGFGVDELLCSEEGPSAATGDLHEMGSDDDDGVLSFPLYKRESLALLYLYAASEGGHIGAQLALGFRHVYGLGVPKRCTAGATYYLNVARQVAHISSSGIPPVAEIVRLDLNSVNEEGGNPVQMQSRLADLQQHLADSGHPRIQTAVAKKYLLGIEGYQQNYHLAVHYFKQAALRGYRESMSWLGYLATLGIGVEKDYDLAMKLFLYVLSTQSDPMAHNGLGYLYFVGTSSVPSDVHKAVHHFKLSAAKDFPDAQYNLAALYMTGVGIEQSFRDALKLLAKAVEQGHSSAMYLLGVMHFNGLGTLRDCSIASGLFKRVAERHPWVSEHLKKAYSLQSNNHPDEAAFVYWDLAESGLEFVQSNLAESLDGGGHPLAVKSGGPLALLRLIASYVPGLQRRVVTPTALFSSDHRPSLGVNRALAHRYWDLAALQRSSQALIRLGDYAYNGWGVEPSPLESLNLVQHLINKNDDIVVVGDPSVDQLLVDSSGKSMEGWGLPRQSSDFYRLRVRQYQAAYSFYDRASSPQRPVPNIKQTRVYMIKAEHLLSHMHESGFGVKKDLSVAKQHLVKISQIDPQDTQWLVNVSLLLLRFKSLTNHIGQTSLLQTLRVDYRLFFVLINSSLILFLQLLRPLIARHRHHHSD